MGLHSLVSWLVVWMLAEMRLCQMAKFEGDMPCCGDMVNSSKVGKVAKN